MAADASEKAAQGGTATPRQSISDGRTTLHTSPGSQDRTITSVETAGETIPGKVASKAVDDSSEDQVNLQKLDSRALKKPPRNDDPYAHLDPQEAAVLKRQVDTPDIKVGVAMLYRYATRVDLILLSIGCSSSIISGALLPLMTVIFGNLQGTFSGFFNGTVSQAAFDAELVSLVLYFVYLAIAMFVFTYTSTVIFIYTGEHIAGKIRERYLEACMRQNIVSLGHAPPLPRPDNSYVGERLRITIICPLC